jgi:phage terminase small subunit
MSDLPLEPQNADAPDLIESDPLSPREALFCKYYSDIESSSYGRATRSAERAGYESEPHQAAWRLRRRPRIIEKIAEYQAAALASVGKVFSDLENQRLLALEKGDLQAANRASELQGKHLAMFTDRVVIDEVVVHEYDERVAEAASRLARLLLEEEGDEALGLLASAPARLPAPAVQESRESGQERKRL